MIFNTWTCSGVQIETQQNSFHGVNLHFSKYLNRCYYIRVLPKLSPLDSYLLLLRISNEALYDPETQGISKISKLKVQF